MLAKRVGKPAHPVLRGLVLVLMFIAAVAGAMPTAHVHAQASNYEFLETGALLEKPFFAYWQQHGGVAQLGLPITNPFQEKNATDGKTYTVQYFQRAIFEYHPENAGTPYEVLPSLLGTFAARGRTEVAFNPIPDPGPSHDNDLLRYLFFPATGHKLKLPFLNYWEQHGGLALQGYPISEQFQQKSDLNGQTYTVQYFQRAIFEYHPENAGTPYEVLLSQLGTFQLRARYDGYSNVTISDIGKTVEFKDPAFGIVRFHVDKWNAVGVAPDWTQLSGPHLTLQLDPDNILQNSWYAVDANGNRRFLVQPFWGNTWRYKTVTPQLKVIN